MALDHPNLPHVGLFVEYYPDDKTRLAALVTEVHQTDDLDERPKVNLVIFNPDGTQDVGQEIEPVNEDDDSRGEGLPTLQERWGFAHEFMVDVDEDDPSPLGTNSNVHVGELNL